MAKPKKISKSEESIIEIIKRMVAEGESEDHIINTLKELGVDPVKAKRLLLLGQADTFALLSSEIRKIVKENMETEKKAMLAYIEAETRKVAGESKFKIEKEIMDDLKKYEKDITGQSQTFHEQINETVAKFTELSERVRAKLNDLGAQVQQVQLDMDEVKLKGVGSRNRHISFILVVLGIVFCVADLYLFMAGFGGSFSIDSLIIAIVMAVVGISLLFIATIV